MDINSIIKDNSIKIFNSEPFEVKKLSSAFGSTCFKVKKNMSLDAKPAYLILHVGRGFRIQDPAMDSGSWIGDPGICVGNL